MQNQKIKQAIQLVGNKHKYQKILVFLIFLAFIQFDFVLLGSTLIFMDPLFNCISTGTKNIFQSEACQKISQCTIVDTFTLTAYLNLYCDLQWARDAIQSVLPLGSAFGLIFMNLISDTKGRKISTILSLYLTVVGMFMVLIGGYWKSIYSIIIGQFIAGFGLYPLISLSYALLSDFCGDTFRPRAIIIVNMAWSLSAILLGCLYLLKMQWLIFLSLTILIPLIAITLFMQFYIQQPPYILIYQNRKQQALQSMLKISKINGTYQKNHQKIRQIIRNQQFRKQQEKTSFKNIFKIIINQQNYLRTILILAILRIISSLNFYGTSYAFALQGMGLGYNSMFAGIVEIASFVILTGIIHKLPRKKGMSGFNFIVFLIGFLYLFPFVSQSQTNGTVVMCLSRFFSTISSTLIASVQTQAFTARIQSSAVGFIQCLGLIGGILGPILVDISDKIGINEIVFLSLIVSFAVWMPVFLKQTLKQKKKEDDNLQQSLVSKSEQN